MQLDDMQLKALQAPLFFKEGNVEKTLDPPHQEKFSAEKTFDPSLSFRKKTVSNWGG